MTPETPTKTFTAEEANGLVDFLRLCDGHMDDYRLRVITGVGPICQQSECAVVGMAAVMDLGDFSALRAICVPEDFYWQYLRTLYSVLLRMADTGLDTHDPLIVQAEMVAAGHTEYVAGEKPWLSLYLGCTDFVVSSSLEVAQYHATRVRDCSIKRRALRACKDMVASVGEADTTPAEIVGQLTAAARTVESRSGNSAAVSVADAARDMYGEMVARVEQKRRGVLLGIHSVDYETNGLQDGNLVILAGRPSTGKSALAFQWAAYNAERDVGVVAFSLEMPKEDLLNRVFSSRCGIPLFRVIHGRLNTNEMGLYANFLETASTWPLYICDLGGSTPADVRLETQRQKAAHPEIRLVVVDYLQLMESGERHRGESRQQEVSTISRRMKVLARDLNIPILALAQMSRNIETRGEGAEPKLSDLRESGAIEQDADVVAFLHRRVKPAPDNRYVGKVDFILAKHRNGPLSKVPLAFHAEFVRFAEMAPETKPPKTWRRSEPSE